MKGRTARWRRRIPLPSAAAPTMEVVPGSSPCADVALIGVRGADERFDTVYTGMGPTVSGVSDRAEVALRRQRRTWRVARFGVRYPASSWTYWLSRRLGARSLALMVSSQGAKCPDQRFVLIGLSQGADVVRRGLRHPLLSSELLDRVTAVVLLGDPTRDPRTGPEWHHGTEDPRPGILARFGSPLPLSFEARTWSFCLDGDEVAANHRGVIGAFRSGTHTLYEHNRDQVQDQAAAFIISRLLVQEAE